VRLALHRHHDLVQFAVGQLVGIEREQVAESGVQSVGELGPHASHSTERVSGQPYSCSKSK
jgi:hypothetical protein